MPYLKPERPEKVNAPSHDQFLKGHGPAIPLVRATMPRMAKVHVPVSAWSVDRQGVYRKNVVARVHPTGWRAVLVTEQHCSFGATFPKKRIYICPDLCMFWLPPWR